MELPESHVVRPRRALLKKSQRVAECPCPDTIVGSQTQDVRAQCHDFSRTNSPPGLTSRSNERSLPELMFSGLRWQVWAETWGILCLVINIILVLIYNGHLMTTALRVAFSILLGVVAFTQLFVALSLISLFLVFYLWQDVRPLSDAEMIDAASRGVLGMIQMAWKGTDATHNPLLLLLCLGALLAQASAALNSYMLPIKMDLAPQPSVIPALVANSSSYDSHGLDMRVALGLKSNVYSAVFNEHLGSVSHPQYFCPSANCAWPPIASLEAWTLCTHISDRLTRECGISEDPEYVGLKKCTISLPGNGTSSWYLREQVRDGIFITPVARAFSLRGVQPGQALVYHNATISPVQLVAPRLTDAASLIDLPTTNFPDDEGLDNLGMWVATECSVEPIVRVSIPVVTASRLKDSTLAIRNAGTWVLPGSHSSDTIPPGWHIVPAWEAELSVQTAQSFILGTTAISAIGEFFEIAFSGQVEQRLTGLTVVPTNHPGSSYAPADVAEAVFYGNGKCKNPDMIERFSCIMADVAAGISKSFRDSSHIAAGFDIEDFGLITDVNVLLNAKSIMSEGTVMAMAEHVVPIVWALVFQVACCAVNAIGLFWIVWLFHRSGTPVPNTRFWPMRIPSRSEEAHYGRYATQQGPYDPKDVHVRLCESDEGLVLIQQAPVDSRVGYRKQATQNLRRAVRKLNNHVSAWHSARLCDACGFFASWVTVLSSGSWYEEIRGFRFPPAASRRRREQPSSISSDHDLEA